MKIKLLAIWLFLPSMVIAQIPVTDAATNASIGISNTQLMNVNIQLKAVNKNLSRVINLLEKNNRHTLKSKEILKEELDAKKKAPSYVTKSTDVQKTMDLKSKILVVYRTSKNTLQGLQHLSREETDEFFLYATEALIKTKNLFKQCNEILKTKAIILPEERLKKVEVINIELERILDELIALNTKLKNQNTFRKSRRTLIDMNKN